MIQRRLSATSVDLVVDADAAVVGRAARLRLDAGVRVAVFLGDADDEACAEFLTDAVRGVDE